MGKKADKTSKGSLKGPLNTVSIVNVEVPDADQRLQRAIELLLDEPTVPKRIIPEELNTNRTPEKQQDYFKEDKR